jgi:hypothetical protein
VEIPIYINSFNRLSYLQAMIKELRRFEGVGQITIVDQASEYPPLLEWFRNECPVHVIRKQDNDGPRGVWAGMSHSPFPFYIVTDPDLDLSGCPADLIPRMLVALQTYSNVTKCGPSIRLDDIPQNAPWHDRIMLDEQIHYQNTWDEWWWEAAIDTTFAMYRTGEHFSYFPALRAPHPYQVRHLPYYHVPASLTEEDRWYIEHLPQKHKGALYFSTLQQDEKHLLGI